MRLQLILPRVEPAAITPPSMCPYEGCDGTRFQFLQEVDKPLRDTQYPKVMAHRYECLRCSRTFRVYPQGVTKDHISRRVKGLGILLYLLGLSHGAVSLALDALGVYMHKSRVYGAVQATAERVPGMKRERVFERIRTPALGGDVTSVKVKGKWFPLGLIVDDTTGLALTVDGLSGEDVTALKEWMEPIAEMVGAEILVTDDADAFRTAADDLGLNHQVCKGHVKHNTETLIESLHPAAETDADGSLAAIGVTPAQATADLKRLGELIISRQPGEVTELETLHRRYLAAPPPGKGEKTAGWWIKERYRTMRGYKRVKSAVNVSRLLAWCGNHPDRGGADLTLLLA